MKAGSTNCCRISTPPKPKLMIQHLDGLADTHPQAEEPAMNMKDFKPAHFNWRVDGGVADRSR